MGTETVSEFENDDEMMAHREERSEGESRNSRYEISEPYA